jgi:hypothetical protein
MDSSTRLLRQRETESNTREDDQLGLALLAIAKNELQLMHIFFLPVRSERSIKSQ